MYLCSFLRRFFYYFILSNLFDLVFSELVLKQKLSADTSSKMCYDLSENAMQYAGSATPYEFVGNFNSEKLKFPGCIPVKLWMVVRHGARTPSKHKINYIKDNLPRIRHHILYNHMMGRGELPDETIQLFKDWTVQLPDNEKELTEYGSIEIYLLAKRFQERFPQLLPDDYSQLHYHFRHSRSQRTRLSAHYYALGLFPDDVAKRLEFPELLENRFLLKFTEFCKKWEKEMKRNPGRFIEHLKFLDGPEINQLTTTISSRLGLNETLLYGGISSMLHTCASEFVWNGYDSPWCHIFTESDLEVISYENDLKSYYRDAYGHKINYAQACPMVKDMMQFLMDDASWPPVVASFSHSGAITKFIAALGMYMDEKPLTNKYVHNRKWKGSRIDPFSSNFAAVLYRCNNHENRVLTLHQERLVSLPGCPENDLCPLDILISNYNETVNNCNFETICDLKKKLNFDLSSKKEVEDEKGNKESLGIIERILSFFE